MKPWHFSITQRKQAGGNAVTLFVVTNFQNCLCVCQLEEMPSTRAKYTCSNSQDDRTFSKIDWVFVNGDLDG